MQRSVDAVRDPLESGPRQRRDQRVDGASLADDPEERDEHDQHREERQHRVVGERCRPVGEVVLLELVERALEDRPPVAPHGSAVTRITSGVRFRT